MGHELVRWNHVLSDGSWTICQWHNIRSLYQIGWRPKKKILLLHKQGLCGKMSTSSRPNATICRSSVSLRASVRYLCFILLSVKLLKPTDTYLPIRHHRQIGLETVRRSIYSIMRQSVLILLDWLLRSVPVAAGIAEAVVGGVVLVLLRWGEGVEISLHVPLGLGVELRLERGQLLGHTEEPSDFYTEDHPDYIWGEK